MRTIEGTRKQFLPERITTLFVSDSAANDGTFFYCGTSPLLSQMRKAVEWELGESDDFLQTFKNYGWYLDDVVLEPIGHLKRQERLAKCRASRNSLAQRISDYKPEAIVSLLKCIAPIVKSAAKLAGCQAPRFAVPFPAMGQQVKFQSEMRIILSKLPRLAPHGLQVSTKLERKVSEPPNSAPGR